MTTTYCLSGRLDSASAPALVVDLLRHRGQPLCIDASAITYIGTLPLQVLIATQKQWYDDGHNFATRPLSLEFSKAAKGLGVPLDAIGALEEDFLRTEVGA